MPNGIDLILEDHQIIDALFAAFDETAEGAVVGQIIDVLTAHDDAEHAALYPLAGHVLGDEAMITRAALAHSMVKKQIDDMKSKEGAPLAEAVAVLRQLVAEHVRDEETELLPQLQAAATPQQLDGLAARILQAKQRGG